MMGDIMGFVSIIENILRFIGIVFIIVFPFLWIDALVNFDGNYEDYGDDW